MIGSLPKAAQSQATKDTSAAIPSVQTICAEHLLSRFANKATAWTGGTPAFLLAVGVIFVWLISGPFFGFSDTWQLIINSGTSIITFLMVFLIQRSQNKDSQAIHLKLNELIAAVNGASNRLINVEQDDDEQIRALRDDFRRLVERVGQAGCTTEPHSIAELSGESAPSEIAKAT